MDASFSRRLCAALLLLLPSCVWLIDCKLTRARSSATVVSFACNSIIVARQTARPGPARPCSAQRPERPSSTDGPSGVAVTTRPQGGTARREQIPASFVGAPSSTSFVPTTPPPPAAAADVAANNYHVMLNVTNYVITSSPTSDDRSPLIFTDRRRACTILRFSSNFSRYWIQIFCANCVIVVKILIFPDKKNRFRRS